jgi:hypothetical protein
MLEFQILYVFCVYSAMSKRPNTTAKLSRAETSVILIVFFYGTSCGCDVCAYTVIVSYE